MVQSRVGGLLVRSDPFVLTRREQIIAAGGAHAFRPCHSGREGAWAGGPHDYGNIIADAYRRVRYATADSQGAKPSQLPVDQATNFS